MWVDLDWIGYAHQYDFDPIQGQDQGHLASEVLKIALLYVYLLCHFGVHSKLMVDYDNMEPTLQLVGARFLNFHLSKLSCDFKLHRMWILHSFINGHISVLLDE